VSSKTLTGNNAAYVVGSNGLTLTNTGTVSGNTAITVNGSYDIVLNLGTVSGTGASGIGIILGQIGGLTNAAGGVVSGKYAVVIKSAAATLVNSGSIAGNATTGVGVYLQGGGSASNQSGGSISGKYGVRANRAATITNAGTIAGATDAVLLAAGFANQVIVDPGAGFVGTVSGGNTLGATSTSTLELASGSSAGTLGGLGSQFIDFAQVTIDSGAAWTLTGNSTLAAGATLTDGGTLTNTGSLGGTGVSLAAGAVLVNAAGATLSNSAGVVVDGVGDGVTVANAGTIRAGSAHFDYGVLLNRGGAVTNLSGGLITGLSGIEAGIGPDAIPVTVTNAGSIGGSQIAGYGILLFNGGQVTNQAGGTITGAYAVRAEQAATVTNAGSINGALDAVLFAAGFANRLVVAAGAAFTGTVDGGNTLGNSIASTLEFAAGATAGTLGGLGTQFVDFAHVTIDSGAAWTVTGANTIALRSTLSDSGTLSNAGTLTGNTAAGAGVVLAAGGVVINRAGSSITGFYGVKAVGAGGTVINAGSIGGLTASGIGAAGILLSAAANASVTNQAGGTITGYSGIEVIGSAGSVLNAGRITGRNAGIYLHQGGTVTNAAGGTISGEVGILVQTGAATVVNAGSLGGAGARIDFAAGFANRLVIDPGASFGGTVDGANTFGSSIASTLELAAGTASLTAASSQFTDFAQVTIDSGGAWTWGGTNTIAAGQTLANSGTLVIGGTLVNAGSILGNGVSLAAGGALTNAATGAIARATGTAITGLGAATVVNAGSIAGGTAAVSFAAGAASRLVFDAGASFTGTVDGGNTLGSTIVSTLELAAGASYGVLSGLGTQFVDFARVTIDSGLYWQFSGTNTLGAGATLTNSGSLIDAGTLANSGSLTGNGILLAAGGLVDNRAGGAITGTTGYGIVGGSGAGTVVNAGSIVGNASVAAGIYLFGGGTLANQSGGSIRGAVGVGVHGGNGLVQNAGLIAGTVDAVIAGQGATVSNQSGGTIAGTYGVAGGTGTATVWNAGSISGTSGDGVELTHGGAIANQAGGSIAGGRNGVEIRGGAGTVVNAGSITGGTDAVVLAAGFTNRLVVDPGAQFTGTVEGGNAPGGSIASTLELAAGSGPGTLAGLGTQFVDFAQVTIDGGAAWTLAGAATLAAGSTLANAGTLTLGGALTLGGTLSNSGSIAAAGGTEAITAAALTGSGVLLVGNGGNLVLNVGSVAATQSVRFTDASGILTLGSGNAIGGFSGLISGFAVGDTIVVDTTVAAGFSLSGSIVSVVANGGTLGTLSFASARQASTAITTAGALQDNALCFLRDTLIATPAGEVPVQHLQVGDMVCTVQGAARPILWLGEGRVLAARGRRSAATPVIVRKGALGPNLPHRDLRVTKGHALLLDGVLIPVEFLVNHRSILWDDRAQEVALHHIELATHDVLLANGAPAESYRDDGNRWLFQTSSPFWDTAPKPPCRPVLTGGPVVDAVWHRLLDCAGPRPGMPLTDDPDLHLLADGVRLDAALRCGDAWVFALPRRPAELRIASRAAAPAELGVARDPRVLGVALRRIVLRQGTRFAIREPADPALTSGVHRFESATGLRWTDGDARLPPAWLAPFDGPLGLELVLLCGGATRYPLPGKVLRAARGRAGGRGGQPGADRPQAMVTLPASRRSLLLA
jgi:hypothetical protein